LKAVEEKSLRRAIVGYHRPGDFHYFTLLSEGSEFLGQEDDPISTQAQFITLVTQVHEHYHLMQDLLQGFCWWTNHVSDLLAENVKTGIARSYSTEQRIAIPLWDRPEGPQTHFQVDPDAPFSMAQRLALEMASMERLAASSKLTASTLAEEVRLSPGFDALLPVEAYELTTLDLLECQAAMLTEIYINKLMVEQSARFAAGLADAFAPFYRVPLLPREYGRPLRILLAILEKFGVRFEMQDDAHPMYDQIAHGAVYFTLIFLLDYALHIPPDPLRLLTAFPDGATLQDLHPPLRFMTLAFLYASAVGTDREGTAKILRNEGLLYTEGAAILARFVNELRSGVREDKSVKTFFPFAYVTDWWIDELERESPLKMNFPDLHSLLMKAVQLRKDRPAEFLEMNPLGFDLSIGLPRIFITARGLRFLPYFAETQGAAVKADRGGEAEPDPQIASYLAEGYRTFLEGMNSGNWEHRDFPITLVPFRFIQAVLGREMYSRFAEAVLFRGKVRCPLTESLGAFVPCSARGVSCESIADPSGLPRSGCRLRTVVNDFWGNADRFEARSR
jgi:hypothetical protein